MSQYWKCEHKLGNKTQYKTVKWGNLIYDIQHLFGKTDHALLFVLMSLQKQSWQILFIAKFPQLFFPFDFS